MKIALSLNPLPLVLPLVGLLCLANPSILPNEPDPAIMQRTLPVRSDSTRLYLPDDLEATLWAEAPMFFNPTNMDIDARGRVWITEAVNYRKFNNKADERLNHPDGERVVILEDTNGDGKADDSKVFVTDSSLVSPLGIAVIDNKVIVSCSPNIIVYTDLNGDDKADRKEVLLTGFGGLDHDHALHAVVAGPDGNYYFNTGNAGPHVVTDKSGWTLRSGSLYVGGTPYNKINHGNQVSDDGRVWTGGMALRVRPDGTGLKVMAHNFRNNYETAVDSYGNMWQNDNDDQVVACRTSWLMEGANAGYFSTDGTRYWQADQRPGQSTPTAHWHQEDPGVLPVGDMTGAGSPTGMVVYEGDELGPNYRGMLLSAEAGRNVIFGYKPEPMGAGYRMPRTDLISTFPQVDEQYKWNEVEKDARKWFRASDVAVGPDGAIYVADWYDPIVGGHQMQDKEGYGRIYRITPKGKKLKMPRIDLRSTQGQITALLNPAVNVRMLGFEALRAQGDKAVEPVMALLTSTNPYHRARATFLLAHLGAEGQFEVERLLKAVDATVRVTALRALRSITPENSKANPALTPSQEALLPLLGNLSTDPSPAVRREVAVALRDVPFADCRYMLQNLVKRYDGQDRYYLTALGEAADGKEEAVFADLRATMPTDPLEWDQRTADLVWELHPASAVAMLKKRAAASTLTTDARRQALVTLGFIKSTPAAQAMVDLMKSPDKSIADEARYWVGFRRGNDWATLLNWDELMPNKQSAGEQKALARRQLILDEYKSFAEKSWAAREMAKDADGGRVLVGMAAENKLPDALIKVVAPIIAKNPDQTVRTMAKEFFPIPSETNTSREAASTASVALERQTVTDKPVAAERPRVDDKPAIIEKPVATNRPAVTEEPVARERIVVKEKPAAVETTAVEKPALMEKPVVTGKNPMLSTGSAGGVLSRNESDVAEIAALTGNGRTGLTLFKSTCATCHRHGQLGNDVGPELTRIHQKFDRSSLIDAIIHPSAGIAFGYEPWMITTKTGQTYYGFLVSDGSQTVVVKGVTGQKHEIPTKDISSRRQYQKSLMPDPRSAGMSQQKIADIAAFLLKQQ